MDLKNPCTARTQYLCILEAVCKQRNKTGKNETLMNKRSTLAITMRDDKGKGSLHIVVSLIFGGIKFIGYTVHVVKLSFEDMYI